MSEGTQAKTPEEQAAQAGPQEEKPQIRIPESIPVIGSGSTVMYPQQLREGHQGDR